LEPGGLFEGFTWANIEDVTAFAQSAGIDTNTLDFDVNDVATFDLISLLSPTFTLDRPTGLELQTAAFLDDTVVTTNGSASAIANLLLQPPDPGFFSGHAGLRVAETAGDLIRPATSAVMVYRSVPEPDSIALIALFVAGISKYSLCAGGAA